MSQVVIDYLNELVSIIGEMSPYLILGFFIAGLLHVLFPKQSLNKLFGSSQLGSSVNAALFGVPLPLCSCGVIPTGVSLYKNGASKGSTLSFLISTPQTGIDSVLVTYSLLGLPFAVIRPIVAFITGVVGGFIGNKVEADNLYAEASCGSASAGKNDIKGFFPKLLELFRYGFFEFMSDIAKWLVIGLLIAAAISVWLPDQFFESTHFSPIVQVLLVLLASIPLYICATASVPLAAVLMMKGLAPGAALVLLMAGPATNAATITVILKSLGKKALAVYLSTIILGAFLSALFIDYVLPQEWFSLANISPIGEHHHTIPYFIEIGSSIVLGSLLLFVLLRPYFMKLFKKEKEQVMAKELIEIQGMNCNHCKNSVVQNLEQLPFIETVKVDLESGQVALDGENIDFDTIEKTITDLGFDYKGRMKGTSKN